MSEGIKKGTFDNERFPEIQNKAVPVAKGYSDVSVTGDAIPHPKAVMGADAAADDGRPWVIGPSARDGRGSARIGRHDARSGLDKAFAAARPVGGKPNGGGVRGIANVPAASPPANGSAVPPKVR